MNFKKEKTSVVCFQWLVFTVSMIAIYSLLQVGLEIMKH